MLRSIALGVYLPGSSLIHRLRARTKLLVLGWLMVFLVIANQRLGHFAPYGALLLLLALAVAAARVSPGELWRRSWPLVIFTVVGAVPLLLFVTGKTVLTLGPYPATYGVVRWWLLGYVALLLLGALWLAIVPPGRLRLRWRRPWLRRLTLLLALTALAALAAFALLLGTPAGAPLPIGPAVVTLEGLWIVVTATMILLVFYLLALLLTMTTTPVALVEGLTMLLGPLRRVGLPVDDFALMLLIALRFVPTLVDEADALMKAQAARGADVTRGSLGERLMSLQSWFVPLVQGALRRAEELAAALDARGYETQGNRTALHEGPLRAADWLVLGGVLLLTLLAFVP
jgi:energy-coupling factor transporter transmembrane protein EcfT